MSDDGRSAEAILAEARKALWVMVGFLGLIWTVQILNWLDGYGLSRAYGIRARDVRSIPDVVTAPFLHLSWSHIEGNSGPLFIFGFLAAYRGVRGFLGLTAVIVAVSGLGAWFVSGSNTVTAGASGLVFGYFGYVIVRGFFDRHRIDIVIGLVMALCFAYQFSVLLPTEGISWQGHLFGFIAGIAGGWIFRDRHTTAPSAVGGGAPDPTAPAAAGPATTPQSRADLLKQLDDLGL